MSTTKPWQGILDSFLIRALFIKSVIIKNARTRCSRTRAAELQRLRKIEEEDTMPYTSRATEINWFCSWIFRNVSLVYIYLSLPLSPLFSHPLTSRCLLLIICFTRHRFTLLNLFKYIFTRAGGNSKQIYLGAYSSHFIFVTACWLKCLEKVKFFEGKCFMNFKKVWLHFEDALVHQCVEINIIKQFCLKW